MESAAGVVALDRGSNCCRRLSPQRRCLSLDPPTRNYRAELALLSGRALDQSPQYWLNLQADYDLKTAEASIGPRLLAIHSVTHV